MSKTALNNPDNNTISLESRIKKQTPESLKAFFRVLWM